MNALMTLLRHVTFNQLHPMKLRCVGNNVCMSANIDRQSARVKTWMCIVSVAMAFVISFSTTAAAEIPAKQFFTQHCQKCHSGENLQGDFSLASLTEDFADKQNRQQWLTVLEQLKHGNMPPKEKPRPPAEDLQGVMDWISMQAAKAEIARREAEGRVVMRRLNRAEYANTVRDLLGVDVDMADLQPYTFPANHRTERRRSPTQTRIIETAASCFSTLKFFRLAASRWQLILQRRLSRFLFVLLPGSVL